MVPMKKYKPRLGSPKRAQRSRALSDLGQPIAKKALGGRALVVRELILGWRKAVGPDLARVTRPQSVSRARSGEACLTLAVDPGSALAVQHDSSRLIDRINTFIGYQMIGRLRLIQQTIEAPPDEPIEAALPPVDPAKRQEIAAKLKNIRDPEARATLQELGELLSVKQKKRPLQNSDSMPN